MADSRKPRYKGPITLDVDTMQPEAPVTRAGVDLTPFRDTLLKSKSLKDQGSPTPALGFTIHEDAVSLYDSRFRSAATELGIGVSIDVVRFGEARTAQYGLTAGQARIKVEAREKKQFGGKATQTVPNGAAPVKATGLPKPAGKR